jgi:hypothetical protein
MANSSPAYGALNSARLTSETLEAMWQEVKLSGFSFLEKYHSFFMENYQAEVLERFKNYVFSQMEQP